MTTKACAEHQMRRPLLAAIAAIAAAGALLAPASASAATTFSNTSPITIPASGPATPYPSQVTVSGMRGPISNVTVTLHKFGHTSPADVDVLLISPSGTTVSFMSDACGTDDIEDFTWVFAGTATEGIPKNGPCGESSYQPRNYDLGDTWPGQPASAGNLTSLSNFEGENPNGDWQLAVVDDSAGDAGDIEGGWSVSIDTAPVDAVVPGNGSDGKADPYPIVETVSGMNGRLRHLSVKLDGASHQHPRDLDLLLVGPRGQKLVLMSDACGSDGIVNASWSWDDLNADPMPDVLGTMCRGAFGAFRPTDYEPGDVWPAPAPPGPYSKDFSAFDATDPNGDWKLYVNDDSLNGGGYFAKRFTLRMAVLTAPVTLAPASIALPEGTTRELTLRRRAVGPLAPAAVVVRTIPGSAADGDFTPIATTVPFAAGETEVTLNVSALTDGEVEPDESFSVAIQSVSGDAVVGDPASVAVTIPAQPQPETPRVDGGETPLGVTPLVDRTNPVVTTVPGTKVARDGTLKVRVRCSEACGGRVVLTSAKRLRIKPRGTARKLTLGTAPFRLAQSGGITLAVKLSSRGRAAIRLAKKAVLIATATATDTAANKGVGTAKATVRR